MCPDYHVTYFITHRGVTETISLGFTCALILRIYVFKKTRRWPVHVCQFAHIVLINVLIIVHLVFDLARTWKKNLAIYLVFFFHRFIKNVVTISIYKTFVLKVISVFHDKCLHKLTMIIRINVAHAHERILHSELDELLTKHGDIATFISI